MRRGHAAASYVCLCKCYVANGLSCCLQNEVISTNVMAWKGPLPSMQLTVPLCLQCFAHRFNNEQTCDCEAYLHCKVTATLGYIMQVFLQHSHAGSVPVTKAS